MKHKKKLIIAIILVVLLGIMIFAIVKVNQSNELKITFDCNGGSKIESQEIKKGDKLEEPEEPTKDGYEFIGWYYNGKKFDFDQEITKDIKLEAKWIKVSTIKYTVTFDSNGGSKVNSQKVEKGKKATEPEEPTRYGYTFIGWTLNGDTYDFNSKVEKNITLKAIWRKNVSNSQVSISKPDTTPVVKPSEPTKPVEPSEPVTPTVKTYKVTFYDNTTVMKVLEVEEGKLIEKPENPKKEGYVFSAWMCGGAVCDFTKPVTSNMDIFAVWMEVPKDTAYVATLEELKAALANSEIKKIYLNADIKEINETLTIGNTITFYGQNHVLGFTDLATENGVASGLVVSANGTTITDLNITMPGVAGWKSQYALQVYMADDVTINNYTGTGADAALLVNGSKVLLTGTINVSGNEFGGIEASKGKNVPNNSVLTVNATIVMTDEALTRPALWIENGQAEILGGSFYHKEMPEKAQTYYFVDETIVTVANVGTLDELKAALNNTEVNTINLNANITGIGETLTITRKIVFNGNNHTLGFNDLEKVNNVASGLVVSASGTKVTDLNITMPSAAGWKSQYALQVYMADDVVINNYSGTGADAALIANGSKVTLTGTINVSGNEFGGIEASKGLNVPNNSVLTVNATIVMTDEELTRPAIWIENGQAEIVGGNFFKYENPERQQTYYYLSERI